MVRSSVKKQAAKDVKSLQERKPSPLVTPLKEALDRIEHGFKEAVSAYAAAEQKAMKIIKNLSQEIEKVDRLLKQNVDDVKLTFEDDLELLKELDALDKGEGYVSLSNEEDNELLKELDALEKGEDYVSPSSEEDNELLKELNALENDKFSDEDISLLSELDDAEIDTLSLDSGIDVSRSSLSSLESINAQSDHDDAKKESISSFRADIKALRNSITKSEVKEEVTSSRETKLTPRR